MELRLRPTPDEPDLTAIVRALTSAFAAEAATVDAPSLPVVRRLAGPPSPTPSRRSLLAAGSGVVVAGLIGRMCRVDADGVAGPHVTAVDVDAAPGLRVAGPGHLTHRVADGGAGVRTVDVRTADVSGPLDILLPVEPDETFVGLGERPGGLFLRGQRQDCWLQPPTERHRRVSYSPMPVIYTSRSRCLLVDTTARTDWDLAAADPGVVRVRVHAGAVRLHVVTGRDVATMIQRTSAITGRPPLIPDWGLGVWKTALGGTARVQRDIERLRSSGAPLDAVWMYDLHDERSGIGWPWHEYAPIPPGDYGDPRDVVNWLHGRGLRALGYLNPFVRPTSSAWAEATRRRLLVSDGNGVPQSVSPADPRGVPDFTDPAAAAWFGERVARAVRSTQSGGIGLDGAMADYGEEPPLGGRYRSGETGEQIHNRYAGLYLQSVRSAAEAVRPGETVFLARSGTLGSTAWTSARFTGDQERSWDAERGIGGAFRAMLSGSLSGWPYWGPDIGGYYDPARPVDDERELWIRWVELGALSPLMRDHLGHMSGRPVDALLDSDTLSVWRAYARLHRALQPELQRLGAVAHETGLPIVRALLVDHSDDPVAWSCDDQFLLGRDVLAAPVLHPGVRRRSVYLPDGDWVDFWSGTRTAGRAWVQVEAPVRRIPLFVRAGSEVVLPAPDELWTSP